MKQFISLKSVFLGAAALSLLACAAPGSASSTLIQAGTTTTPVPELLTDAATGQTGQTGLTGAGIGVKVACSGGVAGQITVAVKVPGATATAAGQGSVSDEGYGDYAYFPTAAETPQAGSGILYIHMTAPSCLPSDAFGQIVSVNLADAAALGLTQIAKIGTNAMDSPNAVTAQGLAASSGTAIANVAPAVWTQGSRTITGGTITTYSGNTPQTGDSFARLGAPAGASLSADLAAFRTAMGSPQQAGQPVSLPVAPAGYGGSGGAPIVHR